MTEDFAAQAMQLARRYIYSRRWCGYPAEVREDMIGLYVVRIMRVWWQLDPEQNLFAYLTSMARSAAFDYVRKEKRRESREEELAER
jgi:DNA-directed RNA polymerase specialized sigma24 family protein